MIMLDSLWSLIGPPLAVGLLYAVVAALLRRRFGPLASLAFTLVVIAAAFVTVKAVEFPPGALAIPAIPAAAVAGAVLETQARRRSRLVAQIAWTALAFTVVGSAVLYDVAGQLMIVS